MHKLLVTAALVACNLAPSLTAAVHARTLEAVRHSGSITLGTSGTYAPFNYLHGLQFKGYEIDVAEAIVRKMGLQPQWRAGAFSTLLPGLDKNFWDIVIASHTITAARSRSVTFTLPHYCTGGRIISMSSAIHRAQALAGKVVAAQAGTTHWEAAQKIPGIKEVKTFSSAKDARNALILHKVDAWVTDHFMARELHDQASMLGFHVGEFLFTEQVAAAVAKNNQPLADAWNKALKELLADGTIAAISRKHFRDDITCR